MCAVSLTWESYKHMPPHSTPTGTVPFSPLLQDTQMLDMVTTAAHPLALAPLLTTSSVNQSVTATSSTQPPIHPLRPQALRLRSHRSKSIDAHLPPPIPFGGRELRPSRWGSSFSRGGGEDSPGAVEKEGPARPREQLSGQDLADWEECVELVVGLGFEVAAAEKLLGRAFGWGSQGFWMDDRVNQVARPGDLRDRIRYLEGLGLSTADVAQAAKAFPELLGLSVEDRIKKNVRELADKWYIDGPSLRGTILRRPQALGLSVDCGGDCIAECSRCWARF